MRRCHLPDNLICSTAVSRHGHPVSVRSGGAGGGYGRRSACAERERAFRARVDAARSVISTAVDVVADGWIQNAWYQVRDETDTVRTVTAGKLELLERGPVVASCLVGALVHAAGGRYAARGQATGDSLDLVWHAAFAEGQRFGVGFCPPPSIRSVRVLDLTRWNDRPGRCIGQVLELLDAADDLAIVEATNQRRR